MNVHVLAFDLFGTIFDLRGVSLFDLKAYSDHIRKPEWSPITFPKSWENLPIFPDVTRGLQELGERYELATFSNRPIELQETLIDKYGLRFNTLIDLSKRKVFKPDSNAYRYLCQFYERAAEISAEEILVVTANERFGDIEGARAAGMQPLLIRHGRPNDLLELAEYLRERA